MPTHAASQLRSARCRRGSERASPARTASLVRTLCAAPHPPPAGQVEGRRGCAADGAGGRARAALEGDWGRAGPHARGMPRSLAVHPVRQGADGVGGQGQGQGERGVACGGEAPDHRIGLAVRCRHERPLPQQPPLPSSFALRNAVPHLCRRLGDQQRTGAWGDDEIERLRKAVGDYLAAKLAAEEQDGGGGQALVALGGSNAAGAPGGGAGRGCHCSFGGGGLQAVPGVPWSWACLGMPGHCCRRQEPFPARADPVRLPCSTGAGPAPAASGASSGGAAGGRQDRRVVLDDIDWNVISAVRALRCLLCFSGLAAWFGKRGCSSVQGMQGCPGAEPP